MKKKCLCVILCTLALISSACGVNSSTIDNNFFEVNKTNKTSEGIDTSKRKVRSTYYYDRLTDKEKSVYNKIRDGLMNLDEAIIFEEVSQQEIAKIYEWILMEYPELFYMDSSIIIVGDAEAGIFYGVKPKYTMTKEEIESTWSEIEDYKEKVLSNLTEDMSSYELEKAIFDYIVDNTVYDGESDENQNIQSVVRGSSVCMGFAKMFKYLCEQCGIECILANGDSIKSGFGHAWDYVNLDGKWYVVDSSSASSLSSDRKAVDVKYLKFNITNDILAEKVAFDIEALPQADSIEENYFYVEGLYLKSWDVEQFKEIFQKAIDKGDESLTVRVDNYDVLDDLWHNLVGQEMIYDINEDYNYSFRKDETNLSFSLWWYEKEF